MSGEKFSKSRRFFASLRMTNKITFSLVLIIQPCHPEAVRPKGLIFKLKIINLQPKMPFINFTAEAACKNPHRHSVAGEESPIFLFKSKIKRGVPSDLRPRDDG